MTETQLLPPKWGWQLCLSMLCAAALGVVALGAHDLLLSDGLARRSLGGVLVLLGLLTLASAVSALVRPPRHAWLAAWIAGGPLLIVGLWVGVTAAWHSAKYWPVTIVVSLLVITSATGALLFGRSARRRSIRARVRVDAGLSAPSGRLHGGVFSRGEILAATTTMTAALVALPLSWYSTSYLPAHAVPSVSIKTDLDDLALHEKQGTARLTIKVENTGSTSARLIGSLYTLSGVTVTEGAELPQQSLDKDEVSAVAGNNYGPGARYSTASRSSAPTLLQFGQVVWDQSTLAPNETTEVTIVAFFPVSRFDVLRLGVDLVIGRDDRLRTGNPRHMEDPASQSSANGAHPVAGVKCGESRAIVDVWPIVQRSWVQSLTESEREVVLGRIIVDNHSDGTWWPAVPYLAHQVQRVGHSCAHLFDLPGGLEEEGMVAVSGGMAEKVIPDHLGDEPSK